MEPCMTTLHKKLLWTTTCMVALSIGTIPAAADVLTITVNTSGLNGSAAEIALDFIGGPSPSNNVTITNFLADGSLGLQNPRHVHLRRPAIHRGKRQPHGLPAHHQPVIRQRVERQVVRRQHRILVV